MINGLPLMLLLCVARGKRKKPLKFSHTASSAYKKPWGAKKKKNLHEYVKQIISKGSRVAMTSVTAGIMDESSLILYSLCYNRFALLFRLWPEFSAG